MLENMVHVHTYLRVHQLLSIAKAHSAFVFIFKPNNNNINNNTINLCY